MEVYSNISTKDTHTSLEDLQVTYGWAASIGQKQIFFYHIIFFAG